MGAHHFVGDGKSVLSDQEHDKDDYVKLDGLTGREFVKMAMKPLRYRTFEKFFNVRPFTPNNRRNIRVRY